MLYAREGLSFIIDICDDLLKDNFNMFESEKHRRLMGYILIVYGRPWHSNQGVGKLEEKLIPESYKKLHDRLIKERDKVFAHKDACGVETEETLIKFVFFAQRMVSFGCAETKYHSTRKISKAFASSVFI